MSTGRAVRTKIDNQLLVGILGRFVLSSGLTRLHEYSLTNLLATRTTLDQSAASIAVPNRIACEFQSKESSETQPHYCLGSPQTDFLEKSQFPIRLDSFGETAWSSRKRMCRCRTELCHRGCHTKPLFRSLLFEPLLLGNSFGILLCPVRSRKPAQTAVPRIRFENVASVR